MAAAKPILYSAWISSCSFRVRIALNLKGVDYEYRAVTRTDPDYENINPIKYVPAFVDEDFVVSDSLAIILVRCSSVIFFIYRHLNSIDKLLAFCLVS